jgi:hypothetical protein
MKDTIKKIKLYFISWWKRHIVNDCPPELDDEFSEKYR